MMRSTWLAFLTMAGFSVGGLSGQIVQQPAPARGPVQKGLVVHEWGVFRVHNDLDLANADMRAIWEGLPRFVYGQFPGRQLPQHWQNLEIVDRPVLFFHSPQALDLRLRVDFPGGFPAVWWPGTESPAIQYGKVVGATRGRPARFLEWRLRLKQPPFSRRAVGLHAVDSGHWVKTLRAVQADEVFARVGERNFGYEREKFIYYDGLLPQGKWVALTVHKDRVAVRNRVRHPVFDLTVVDDRVPERIRVARVARLGPRAEIKTLAFVEVDRARWPALGVQTLTRQLTEAGLFEDEAGSLVELWKQELFQAGGLTLFYRLPQTEYERLLPLRLTPRPERLVRVGLVQHPHCEPDLAERVAGLVRDLDSKRFKVRERVQKELATLGRAAFVHLVRLHQQTRDLEIKTRIERLLKRYDATRAFRP